MIGLASVAVENFTESVAKEVVELLYQEQKSLNCHLIWMLSLNKEGFQTQLDM